MKLIKWILFSSRASFILFSTLLCKNPKLDFATSKTYKIFDISSLLFFSEQYIKHYYRFNFSTHIAKTQ